MTLKYPKTNEFTQLLGELRVLSNEMRQKEHDKIINWEDDAILRNGTITKALVMILPTIGCKYALAKHGGCSMCTLPMDNPMDPTEESIKRLPERLLSLFSDKGGIEKFKSVKFYTSGSFLDRWELPIEIRESILRQFGEIVDEVIIETRCEFVIKKNIDSMLSVIPKDKLIIAIGQESLDDEINNRSINKGHTRKQFTRAVQLLHSNGIQVKGYILMKSIFMSELSAVYDAVKTAKLMMDLRVDNISINPRYIGKATLMDKLFKEDMYRPPWLWSVYLTTKTIKKMMPPHVRVICDPVAAGSERGPSNCGRCDKDFKSSLKEFSASQDIDLLNMDCDCFEIYKSVLLTEHTGNGMGLFGIFRK